VAHFLKGIRKHTRIPVRRVLRIDMNHRVFVGDAKRLDLADGCVHLIVTSPPYWNIKNYGSQQEQIGHIEDYQSFLTELDKVWSECLRVLVPGGRLVVVVGDVLLSRKKHKRHMVVPLHSDIQVRCRAMGFDNLAPVIWHKITSVNHEGRGPGMLGKPYEPNSIIKNNIKNNIEYVLMLRKPGGYRSPTPTQRALSKMSKEDYATFFSQIWTDIPGARRKDHPAPFPVELANRIIRMFSFVGDTVLDPFVGSGTTCLAAQKAHRNSIGCDVNGEYVATALARLHGKEIPS
jgi:modification methylase